MRIEHLAEFADLASTLSYADSAERMLISQSALSRHIRAMEEELGLLLFERTSRRVVLTPHGERLLPAAEAVRRVWSGYLDDVRAARTRTTGSLDLATNYYVSDAIAEFLSHHPSVSVRQVAQGQPSRALLELLERGGCDLAVVTGPVQLVDHLDAVVVARDSFVAALPADHPFAAAPSLDPARLSAEHFISFQPGSIGDEWVRRICADAGFDPDIIFSSEVGSSIAQLVSEHLGVALLQKRTIAKMLTHDVAFVDLEPAVEVEALLCWDRRRPLSAAASSFRDTLRARGAATA